MPRILACLTLGAVVCACAGTHPPRPDYDPWEPYNRGMFWLNDQMDVYALAPVAEGWNFVVPDAVQRSFVHFFNNLRFPIVFVNDILQGKPKAMLASLARFQINTFLGGLGFFDLAEYNGLPVQQEDTGQTFGVWSIAPGPYLVLPFFGPSSPRDAVGLAGDAALGFYTYFVTIPGITVGASALEIVNRRSRYLDEVTNAKEASLDYYTFVRNAYVQRRYRLIHDEVKATDTEEEELYNVEDYEDDLEGDQP